jgi:hypothetical protein
MNKYSLWIALLLILFTTTIYSQDGSEEIDASKPTNFYSMLDNTIENTNSPGQNVFGYRGKILFAPSEAHLILGEIPLLYNDRTSAFGVGDIRARYFFLPYKNYDKFLGAFGPSIDVFAPTGSFENGIGGGRWIISPGITVGLMAADWIQFFPILSYQYASKPVYDNPLPAGNKSTNGLTFQVLTPLVISEKFFLQITPIFKMNDLGDERQDRYVQELFASYALASKIQITGFYNGNFKDEIHQLSIGLTVFL